MDWNLLKIYIFGDMTLEFVVAFYIFSFLGMFLTLMLHLTQAYTKAKRLKKRFKFSLKFWLHDNCIRIITNVFFIFVIIRFYDSLHLNYKLDMFLGLVVGLSIDAFIIFIREKTPINIFQSMKSPLVPKPQEDIND